jgi:photosystem II stability/assembly factor-like uncharacterized protein
MKKEILILCFVSLVCGNILSQESSQPNKLTIVKSNNNYLPNLFVQNYFFSSPTGGCYLYRDKKIYNSLNNTCDNWGIAYENTISICQDPTNLEIIYRINSSNEISKSMDNGNNWIVIQNGLPSGLNFYRITVNPSNTSEVYLLTSSGIFRTIDAGFTWVIYKQCEQLRQFIIDCTNKKRLYVLNKEGILFSNDEGSTWKNISGKLPTVLIKRTGGTAEYKSIDIYSISYININTNSYLLAQTEKGTFKTMDNGEQWTKINNDYINSTYIYKTDVYIGGMSYNSITKESKPVLYKSNEYGDQWNKIELKSEEIDNILGIYKDDSHSGIFITTANNRIVYIDSALNYIGLNYGLLTHSIVHSEISCKQDNKEITYALIENNSSVDVEKYGVWKSTDLKKTWQRCIIYNKPDNTYDLRKLYVSPFNPNEVWLFDRGYNIISLDGGKNWGSITNNKIKVVDEIQDFQFDPLDNNILFFVTCYYHNGDNKLVRFDKTTLGSTVLHKIDDERRFNIVISKNDNKKIFISNGEISNDGGWTWHSVYESMDKIASQNGFNINRADIILIEYNGNTIEIEINEKSMFVPRHYARMLSNDNGLTWVLVKKWEDKASEND